MRLDDLFQAHRDEQVSAAVEQVASFVGIYHQVLTGCGIETGLVSLLVLDFQHRLLALAVRGEHDAQR